MLLIPSPFDCDYAHYSSELALPTAQNTIHTLIVQTLAMQSSEEQTLQDRNKYLVARYNFEVWVKGNVDIIDEVCSEDFTSDTPIFGRHCGRSAVKKMLLRIKEARGDCG
jgi:hypothetical protein